MYLDPNDEHAYVLQWITEAKQAIRDRLRASRRNNIAYQFEPSKNTYKIAAKQLTKEKAMKQGIAEHDWDRIQCGVDAIPDGKSEIYFDVVETNVNQLSGGIGQYEYTVFDKSRVLDPNLEQLLELNASRVYNLYGLDSLKDQSIREIQLNAATYYYTFYNQKSDDIEVELLNISQVIIDPIRFRRGKDRYIGFHKMISWSDLEKEIEFKEEYLDTINDVKVYAKNIQDLMNNPNAQVDAFATNDLRADIANIYTDQKYTSNATTIEAEAKQKYQGEDVEITYLWDLSTGDKFSVVNRKFIVDKEEKALDVNISIKDSFGGKEVSHSLLKRLDSPIIEIPFIVNPNLAYPITPLDYHADTFDEICSMTSLKKHNESIAGTLTPFGSDYDLAILANAGNVSGVGVTGMDGTIGFLNKQYDPTFMDSRIEERCQKIRKSMNAYSQIDMQMMIGDRASAKEAGQANNAVAAGHNSLVHNLEIGYSKILRNINLLTVKYKHDKVIKVNLDDDLPTVNVAYLALDAVLNVKMKSEVERVRQQSSLVASQLIAAGANNQYINQEIFMPKMLEIIFGGLLSRTELRSMIKEPVNQEAINAAVTQAQNNAGALRLEQEVVSQNPQEAIAARMAREMTPQDMETFAIEQELQNGGSINQGVPSETAQPGVDPNGELVPDSTGLPPEIAGEIANGGLNV